MPKPVDGGRSARNRNGAERFPREAPRVARDGRLSAGNQSDLERRLVIRVGGNPFVEFENGERCVFDMAPSLERRPFQALGQQGQALLIALICLCESGCLRPGVSPKRGEVT